MRECRVVRHQRLLDLLYVFHHLHLHFLLLMIGSAAMLVDSLVNRSGLNGQPGSFVRISSEFTSISYTMSRMEILQMQSTSNDNGRFAVRVSGETVYIKPHNFKTKNFQGHSYS